MDLLPLVSAYLEQVGVRSRSAGTNTRRLPVGAMSSRTPPAYLMNSGPRQSDAPSTSFITGELWNPAGYTDPKYDKKMEAVFRTKDEAKRIPRCCAS